MINVLQAIKESFKKREENSFTFFIDKAFPAFEGHFPGTPLLPAIVQIEIALFCIKRILNKNASVSEIKKAKFVRPVPPDTEISVTVSENAGYYSITIKDEKETYSQMSVSV
jgi:3-hydroxyacyl-[acyl-carrier-protein] dehydratase